MISILLKLRLGEAKQLDYTGNAWQNQTWTQNCPTPKLCSLLWPGCKFLGHLSMLHFSHRRPHPSSVNGWVLLKQVSNPWPFVEPKMLVLSDLNLTLWGVKSLGQGRQTTREGDVSLQPSSHSHHPAHL